MSLFDAILGRAKPVKPKDERLFALSTAQLTLETTLEQHPSGQAGICFRGVDASRFAEMSKELAQVLQLAGKDMQLEASPFEDEYHFKWFLFRAPALDSLVTGVHMVSQTLMEQGFGEQLLCAVFSFTTGGRKLYWVYLYKRGSFYPFAPTSQHSQERDNPLELRSASVMAKEMPVEQDQSMWYALWGIPI